jgi:hypothetical protein
MCGTNSKSCGRPFVVGLLVLGLLCAPSLAYASPPQSSMGVTLSQSEYDEVVQAMESAKESLKRSNEIIDSQSKSLTRLWILSELLGSALVLEAVAATIAAIKK